MQNTLTQSQDRAFRRVAELKEQIQLDQKAKRDLEENYNLVIDEKGEFIKVLQKQVSKLFIFNAFFLTQNSTGYQ